MVRENHTKLIGFGGKISAGKDTAIQFIKDSYGHVFDIIKVGFGDQVRLELPNNVGAWESEARGLMNEKYGFVPEQKTNMLKSGYITETYELTKDQYRTMLQGWGAYKRQQNDRYWILKVRNHIDYCGPEIAIISGIRMKNEVGWLRAQGGVYVRVTREGYANPNPEHAADVTENDLNNVKPDYELITKDGDLDSARDAAIKLFKQIMLERWEVKTGAPLE